MLALARMIMESPIVASAAKGIDPAVENSVGGDAYRPGDVRRRAKALVEVRQLFRCREGRLVLTDALAAADSESPDLLIDHGDIDWRRARLPADQNCRLYTATTGRFLRNSCITARSSMTTLWPMPLGRTKIWPVSCRS